MNLVLTFGKSRGRRQSFDALFLARDSILHGNDTQKAMACLITGWLAGTSGRADLCCIALHHHENWKYHQSTSQAHVEGTSSTTKDSHAVHSSYQAGSCVELEQPIKALRLSSTRDALCTQVISVGTHT